MLRLMEKNIVIIEKKYDDYEGLKNKEVVELLSQFDDEVKEECKKKRLDVEP